MPIKIPDNLPAFKVLNDENIFVMPIDKAIHQDIRALSIAIVNLMPKKIETETQILRLLSNTPLQVDIELVQMASHVSKNTAQEHLTKFYTTFDSIKQRRFDGLIITGAPIELLPFEEVDYWPELVSVMEWSKTNVYSTFHICWGAQAALYYHYGIPKYDLPKKMFGIFPHWAEEPSHTLLRGFDEVYYVPHSRHTEVKRADIEKNPNLRILTASEEAGVNIIADRTDRQFFITGHSEYDRGALAKEYFRDFGKRSDVDLPRNYFPGDNPENPPVFNWRGHANLLFCNWLNYCVYQKTPYNLDELPEVISG